ELARRARPRARPTSRAANPDQRSLPAGSPVQLLPRPGAPTSACRGDRRPGHHPAASPEAHGGRRRRRLRRAPGARRMRVARCADGRSPHTYRWANAVADRGHEVAVVWESQDLAGADLGPYLDSISHWTHVRPTPRRKPWLMPLAPLTAHRLAREL